MLSNNVLRIVPAICRASSCRIGRVNGNNLQKNSRRMFSQVAPIYFVDAFTRDGNLPYTGNPAAVCLLDYDDDVPDSIKQKIAAETNQSVTAFLSLGWKNGEKLSPAGEALTHRRALRWFTPTKEIDLCGHATLGSMKILAETQLSDLYNDPSVNSISVELATKYRGELGAELNKNTGKISLDFPSIPPEPLDRAAHPSWLPELMETALGNKDLVNLVDDVQYSANLQTLLLRLHPDTTSASPADIIKRISPDPRKLLQIKTGNVPIKYVVATIAGKADPKVSAGPARSHSEDVPHFYSRFFAPWIGIDEDHATGSSHTILTPYWNKEFAKTLNDSEKVCKTLLGRQESPRGGNVYCTLNGNRVTLAGEAKITLKGEFFI